MVLLIRLRVVVRRACLVAAGFLAAILVSEVVSSSLERGAIPANRAIRGSVICLDAGHGGIDPGAVGREGAVEKEINLEIARLLGGYLQSAGATVVLTREGDEDLADLFKPEGARKVDDLDLRVEKAQAAGSGVFISIHCNKFPSSSEYGPQTFYVSTGHPDSRRLAETIQKELVSLTGVTWRDALGNSQQYVLRRMSVPAVCVEVGFLSNPADEDLLESQEYRRQVAWAVFMGLARFLSEGLSV